MQFQLSDKGGKVRFLSTFDRKTFPSYSMSSSALEWMHPHQDILIESVTCD